MIPFAGAQGHIIGIKVRITHWLEFGGSPFVYAQHNYAHFINISTHEAMKPKD
jgi:hypothetical protein